MVWKKGFWAKVQPGWAWVPAQWIRQPEGWVFQDGYWDRTLEDRGTLFAPAEVDKSAKGDDDLTYQPYTQVSPEMYGQLYGAFGRPNSNYDGYPGVYYDDDGRFYGYANYGSLGGYYGYLDYPYYGGYGYPYYAEPVNMAMADTVATAATAGMGFTEGCLEAPSAWMRLPVLRPLRIRLSLRWLRRLGGLWLGYGGFGYGGLGFGGFGFGGMGFGLGFGYPFGFGFGWPFWGGWGWGGWGWGGWGWVAGVGAAGAGGRWCRNYPFGGGMRNGWGAGGRRNWSANGTHTVNSGFNGQNARGSAAARASARGVRDRPWRHAEVAELVPGLSRRRARAPPRRTPMAIRSHTKAEHRA